MAQQQLQRAAASALRGAREQHAAALSSRDTPHPVVKRLELARDHLTHGALRVRVVGGGFGLGQLLQGGDQLRPARQHVLEHRGRGRPLAGPVHFRIPAGNGNEKL